jgi:hypothetical protein
VLLLVVGLGFVFGGSESSRERTRRMIPKTARRVRPPGTPAVRGLLEGLVFLCGLGSFWGFEGASMRFGGVAAAGMLGPWSHGGGGGCFGDGEKRGSGGGAMAGCVCWGAEAATTRG